VAEAKRRAVITMKGMKSTITLSVGGFISTRGGVGHCLKNESSAGPRQPQGFLPSCDFTLFSITMKLPLRSLFTFIAATLCAGSVSFAQAIELKQQWRTGKKYVQSMQMQQASTMDMGGQKMEQKMTMNMDMSTAVRAHEDGKQKRLTMKYDRMAMQMNMGGQEMGFDSAKPEDDKLGMGKQFAAMVGKDLKMIANDQDEVTEIENFEEFIGALGGGGAGNPVAQMFTKDALTDMVKQSALRGLPSGPVKPGDSWPWSYKLNMPQVGAVGIKGTYTYKGSGQKGGVPCAEIAVDAKMNFDLGGGEAPAAEAGGAAAMMKAMGMKMTGGRMSGTIWFDNALGMARETQMTQEMEMTMNNPAAPDQKMTIPMKQLVTVTLTKVEDVK